MARSAHLSTCLLLFLVFVCVCERARVAGDHTTISKQRVIVGIPLVWHLSHSSWHFLLWLQNMMSLGPSSFLWVEGIGWVHALWENAIIRPEFPLWYTPLSSCQWASMLLGWDVRVYRFARLTGYYILSLAGLQCVCCGGGFCVCCF